MRALIIATMIIVACITVAHAASAQGRDASLRFCNEEAVKKWPYNGNPEDRASQRDFVYVRCMREQNQVP